jgi:hypothetical protein
MLLGRILITTSLTNTFTAVCTPCRCLLCQLNTAHKA